MLAKYRVPVRSLHPFLEAGAAFRPAGSGTLVTHLGATAGAGVETHLHSLSMSPMLRYTRWRHGFSGAAPEAIVNQVEFLVGFDPTAATSAWGGTFGRKLSIGVLAGVGLGDDLRPAQASIYPRGYERPDANSPIFGALLEFQVYRNFFVEADGIYRSLHATDLSTAEGDVRFAVLTWEFPVLAKYKVRLLHRVRPFAELGPSFRLDGNFNGPTPSHFGVTGGAGLEAALGKLKISPAIRYTRWAEERSPRNAFRAATFLNEVESLVAFSF